jgi:hypothetical protein
LNVNAIFSRFVRLQKEDSVLFSRVQKTRISVSKDHAFPIEAGSEDNYSCAARAEWLKLFKISNQSRADFLIWENLGGIL